MRARAPMPMSTMTIRRNAVELRFTSGACGDGDHLVVGGVSLRGQRDRMGAAILPVGPDADQPALLHAGQRPADRSLVEADDVADARCGNFRLDRQQRQNPPLRDVDAEALLIDHGRAARQFVGDEGNERRDVAVEVEHLFGASAPACRTRARLSVPAHALPKPLQRSRHRDCAHRSARTICRRPT